MSVQTSFSIKDLENLSGVKAHTIRIWEKRYRLLEPERSDTNIRTYDVYNLQKILNVSLLNQFGFKISRIANMDDNEIQMRVQELAIDKESSSHALNSFKMAMMNFDQQLFEKTFNQLLAQNSFREVFMGTLLRLLDTVGLLWSTKTITPAHEHFISTLIQQKLLVNIERVQQSGGNGDTTYVLFLPLNEIHELGLLYIHFELLLKGYKSIFLGSSVPVESLSELQKAFGKTCFISYFTVQPYRENVLEYLKDLSKNILEKRGESLHIIGRNTTQLESDQLPKGVVLHSDIIELVSSL